MLNRLHLLLFILLLGACASTPPVPLELAYYNDGPEEMMPPLSVFIVKPSDELANACRDQGCLREAHFLEALYDELRSSGMFAGVSLRSEEWPWRVYMAARELDDESIASASGKMLLSSASLLALPVSYKRDYRAEFVLAWNGFRVARYSFSIPHSAKLSLFSDLSDAEKMVARSMVSRLIASVQADETFDAATLNRALEASDYDADLSVPVNVAGFTHAATTLLPNPLAGAYLEFRRGFNAGEAYELFVSPLRSLDWRDTAVVLDGAVSDAILEFEENEREGVYRRLTLAEPEAFAAQYKGKPLPGRRLLADLEDTAQNDQRLSEWFFVIEDKLVRLRAMHPPNTVSAELTDAWVQQLIAALRVPPESLFMKQLRQAERRRLERVLENKPDDKDQ